MIRGGVPLKGGGKLYYKLKSLSLSLATRTHDTGVRRTKPHPNGFSEGILPSRLRLIVRHSSERPDRPEPPLECGIGLEQRNGVLRQRQMDVLTGPLPLPSKPLPWEG